MYESTDALQLCCAALTIKGCTKVGLLLLFFTVRPMRVGATLMNDMLFNTALVLLATNAAIQFCAQAFALYANETAIHEIWGDEVSHLYCEGEELGNSRVFKVRD